MKEFQVTSRLIIAESFFCPYLCHFCKKPSANLKICSSCKLISYCSVEHQKKHWKFHQELCSAVGSLIKDFRCKTIFENGADNRSWASVRSQAMSITETYLKRSLNPFERQMFLFPAACALCKILKTDKEFICKNCYSISYCSESHKNLHKKDHTSICEQLKIIHELSYTMACNECNLNLEFKKNGGHFFLPSCLEAFLETFVVLQGNFLYTILSSEMLTCITTILYTIKIGDLKQRSLNISLVGSELTSGPESFIIKYLEIITHWLTDFNEFQISFIGPKENERRMKPKLCPLCSKKKLSLLFSNNLYHNYAQSLAYVQPDIIIIFNCGFHENENSNMDTWKDSIPFLYDSKLTAFTSYCRNEALKDIKRFLELRPPNKEIDIVNECVENPFRSLRPHRDWENDSIYYQNYFISVLKMKST